MSPAPTQIIAIDDLACMSKTPPSGRSLTSSVVMALAQVLRDATLGQPLDRPENQEHNVFFSLQPPSLDIDTYLRRIVEYFGCTRECYVMAFVYIDRIVRRHPDIPINSLSVHRLLLSSVLVAVKFHDDTYYSNQFYANVGGVSNADVNTMEIAFLKLLDWRINAKREEFDHYADLLFGVSEQHGGGGYKLQEGPVAARPVQKPKEGGHWCDGRRSMSKDRPARVCAQPWGGERERIMVWQC